MRPSRSGVVRRSLLAGALALAVVVPLAACAQEREKTSPSAWGTGASKSYVVPALEVAGFIVGLNEINRHLVDRDEYDTDAHTFWRNVRTAPEFDKDPFGVNQLGHPYQGSVYQGLARSAGLGFWESLAYTIGGSFLWESYGETTTPSINDHITTGVGGSFVGESLFRMASLLLEGGGETPGFWRELGAAVISPPTGFNRLAFGDRFDPIFPSHDPAIFLRIRIGATLTGNVDNAGLSADVKRQEGSAEYTLSYGLPGKPGYRYTRPFDYFHFELTAVPNASTLENAIENVTSRGLLIGAPYEVGDAYRGVWGLVGSYEYLSPQIFRLATTGLSLGTVAQWWLSRDVALQGTLLGGLGFGAAGTVADRAERDYHYGLMPHVLLALRLIAGERAMLEATGREYRVIEVNSGPGRRASDVDAETVDRVNLGVTVRMLGPHAIGLHYARSTRDAHTPGDLRDRHQSVETVSLSYSFLGQSRFGAVEWRPTTAAR